jgi:hypothetical protein
MVPLSVRLATVKVALSVVVVETLAEVVPVVGTSAEVVPMVGTSVEVVPVIGKSATATAVPVVEFLAAAALVALAKSELAPERIALALVLASASAY